MNRSQRRKLLRDAGLLGKKAEKNGIKIDKREINSLVKSGEDKRRQDLQKVKNRNISEGRDEKNTSEEYIEFVTYPNESYSSFSDLLSNPNWEESEG
jgi:hypothetical protein